MREIDLMPHKIVFDEDHSIEEWCSILHCEEKDLLFAMNVIGNSSQAVDDYLILNRKKNSVSIHNERFSSYKNI